LFGIEPFVDWQMVYGFMAITTLFVLTPIASAAISSSRIAIVARPAPERI
jgi:hypothetical protein